MRSCRRVGVGVLLSASLAVAGASPASAAGPVRSHRALVQRALLAARGGPQGGLASWTPAGSSVRASGWTGVRARAPIAELGTITGTVTAAVAKTPVQGIEVCAFSLREEEEPPAGGTPCRVTGSTGEYSLSLPAGEYIVEFFAPDVTGPSYADQYFDDQPSLSTANRVTVTAAATTANVDAALQVGGQISGTITSAATHAPLGEVLACALLEHEVVRCSESREGTGGYTLPGLPTGTYKVLFLAGQGYAVQYYKGAKTLAGAEPVSVTAEATTEGIDAALLAVPVPNGKPLISGAAVQGATLTVTHAPWTGSPTSFVDEWGRCTRTAEGELCKTVSQGLTRTLTAEDVGHTFRVRETASNENGAGASVISAATAVVVPPPPAPPSPPSPGPSPSPAGQGVLSSTTSVASAAQVQSLLAGLLAPSGPNARIRALLKHGGYTFSFTALGAATITVSWYLVPNGAHLARAKPVLAASGKVTTSASGVASLKIKLTGRGRSLLTHAHQLKLTAKGAIAEGSVLSTQRKSFKLKR